MKVLFIALAALPLATIVCGQSYADQFETLFKVKDTSRLKTLLANWEKSNPEDPELYTSAINFYFYISRNETVSLDRQPGKPGLQISDSTGKIVAYMNSTTDYRPDQVALAITYIDRGIGKFPTRLDMRFGKCYLFQQIGDYEDFTLELIRAIEYSPSIADNWLWAHNKKLEHPRQFLLETIQEYLKQLYDTQNDSLLTNMKRIGEATIRRYPDNVEILSTTAVANTLLKNYDTAIRYLHMAEKINPKDFIVLNNLASAYKMTGDTANAIKYYELTKKYGDQQAKQQAEENLKKLRK
jgi:tetratricopeptide (TPR) repeat protein